MGGADPDRFEPLLAIRKVEQRVEAGQVAEAVAHSAERERVVTAARAAFDHAVRRAAAAEASFARVVADGASAALLAMALAYGRRCRARIRDAERELARALGDQGASQRELLQAQGRLATARGRRQVLERYLDRARQGQRQLRERRED
jgi:hypothetical protein